MSVRFTLDFLAKLDISRNKSGIEYFINSWNHALMLSC